MPLREQYLATHMPANIHMPGGRILTAKALLDSGATNANYMSGDFYSKHEVLLRPHTTETSTRVFFGDRTTNSNVNKVVTIPLTFTDPAGDIHPATCSLYVLKGKGKDIIIGTPSIFTDFGKLFSSMVGDAVERFGPATVAVDLNNLGYHDLVCPEDAAYPWTTDVMEEAPEDSTIPEASSYNSTVLQFLDQSYDDTVLKFHDWIDTGVDKEFLDSTNVRQLLLDYTDCFVFKEWTGMDIPEVDFTFSDDMPDRMKPHTRSIPQSLQAASKKEFERMTSYFFERCDSPWACPL